MGRRPSNKLLTSSKIREDRISNLPDDVMSHIMSRMPTKYAVRTGSLSRQWKYKHTYILDNIDIDNTYGSLHREVRISSFRIFMNKLLTRYDSRIRSFRIVLHDNTHFPDDLRIWIPKILSRGVQNLAIDAYSIQTVAFPGSLSSCASLTTLKLSLNCTLRFRVNNCFPNLKSLYIHGKHGIIPIRNEQSPETGQLLLTFPVLEVLELRNCRFVNVNLMEINVPQLVTCTFDCAFSYRYFNDYKIKICGPQLVEFNSSNGCLDRFVMCAPRLHYAALENQCKRSEILASRVSAFLRGAPSLEGLKLSSAIAEALVKYWKGVHVLPTFDRVKQLELCWHPKELLELLERMPCLESLKLNMSYWYEYKHEEPLPPCIAPCLKEVEFINFCGENSQIDLAKMFLENVRSLERVIVCLSEKPRMTKNEITRLLSTFVLLSSSCVIVVK